MNNNNNKPILDVNGRPISSQRTIKVLTPEAFQKCFEILDFHGEFLSKFSKETPVIDLLVVSTWLIGLVEAQDPTHTEQVDVMRTSFRDYAASYFAKEGVTYQNDGRFSLFFPVLKQKNLTTEVQ